MCSTWSHFSQPTSSWEQSNTPSRKSQHARIQRQRASVAAYMSLPFIRYTRLRVWPCSSPSLHDSFCYVHSITEVRLSYLRSRCSSPRLVNSSTLPSPNPPPQPLWRPPAKHTRQPVLGSTIRTLPCKNVVYLQCTDRIASIRYHDGCRRIGRRRRHNVRMLPVFKFTKILTQ